MAIRTKSVKWIVALLALALTGLTGLQASLLSGAMELKESTFQRNVMSALSSASDALAVGEATMLILSSSLAGNSLDSATIVAVFSADSLAASGNEFRMDIDVEYQEPLQIIGDTIRYKVENPQQVRIAKQSVSGGVETVLVDSFHNSGNYEIIVNDTDTGVHKYSWSSYQDSSHVFSGALGDGDRFQRMRHANGLIDESRKFKLVAKVMKNFVNSESIPIEKRLDSTNMDSVVQEALTQAGINLDYAYAVYAEPDDSIRLISDNNFRAELAESDFRVRLFPDDFFAAPAYLSIYFPERQMFIWGQMTPMLVATALLTLLILGSFGYSIRSLNRQHRVSELMVDFINNMTHEFKTPIATVTLAAEALDREEVLSDPQKIKRFNAMIKSEAKRMRGQAERILQIAALEERTLELSPVTVDLHEILDDAIRAIDLRVSESGGVVKRDFKATDAHLEADKVHLLNIAHNLLDNANKYSVDAPQITVRTFDSNRGIGFRIEDQGIGIDPQNQKQVFEKYFRAPTGNVHDVKGFGLGLSYVKLIVEQHHGEITLHSVLGEKTEVEVILPRKQLPEKAK